MVYAYLPHALAFIAALALLYVLVRFVIPLVCLSIGLGVMWIWAKMMSNTVQKNFPAFAETSQLQTDGFFESRFRQMARHSENEGLSESLRSENPGFPPFRGNMSDFPTHIPHPRFFPDNSHLNGHNLGSNFSSNGPIFRR